VSDTGFRRGCTPPRAVGVYGGTRVHPKRVRTPHFPFTNKNMNLVMSVDSNAFGQIWSTPLYTPSTRTPPGEGAAEMSPEDEAFIRSTGLSWPPPEAVIERIVRIIQNHREEWDAALEATTPPDNARPQCNPTINSRGRTGIRHPKCRPDNAARQHNPAMESNDEA